MRRRGQRVSLLSSAGASGATNPTDAPTRHHLVPTSTSTGRAISSKEKSSYWGRIKWQGLNRRTHDFRYFVALNIHGLNNKLLVVQDIPPTLATQPFSCQVPRHTQKERPKLPPASIEACGWRRSKRNTSWAISYPRQRRWSSSCAKRSGIRYLCVLRRPLGTRISCPILWHSIIITFDTGKRYGRECDRGK